MLKHQLISQILISTQIMLTRTMKPFFNDFENVSKQTGFPLYSSEHYDHVS